MIPKPARNPVDPSTGHPFGGYSTDPASSPLNSRNYPW
jgi:hypothetical protein